MENIIFPNRADKAGVELHYDRKGFFLAISAQHRKNIFTICLITLSRTSRQAFHDQSVHFDKRFNIGFPGHDTAAVAVYP